MSLAEKNYIETRKLELFFMIKILRTVYGTDAKLDKAIKKHAVLGDDMLEFNKHPDKVLEVLLPVILSYDKERVDSSSLYNSGKNDFKGAIDALLERGVDAFCEELRKVRQNV